MFPEGRTGDGNSYCRTSAGVKASSFVLRYVSRCACGRADGRGLYNVSWVGRAGCLVFKIFKVQLKTKPSEKKRIPETI